jgi:hypothetical protein
MAKATHPADPFSNKNLARGKSFPNPNPDHWNRSGLRSSNIEAPNKTSDRIDHKTPAITHFLTNGETLASISNRFFSICPNSILHYFKIIWL